MDRIPSLKDIKDPIRKGIVVLVALVALWGCSAGRNENPKAVLEEFKIGEVVYVCGCPMTCCNSISKAPDGRCDCRFRLRKGIVSRIQDGKVYVQIPGREKSFFITQR